MNDNPQYGNSFALWREAATQDWQDYTRHAFVQGLADGSLPPANFVHYLVQDYVYLVHYARAWALAVVKAETLDEMKICVATADALINHEMALHVKICAANGIDEAQLFNATEENENLAYTRYVMDAGLSGDFLDLMAALAPCTFGYGEIGLKLAKSAVKNTPYHEWIDTYAGQDYQFMCRAVGNMIDGAVARRIGTEPQNSPPLAAIAATLYQSHTVRSQFLGYGIALKVNNYDNITKHRAIWQLSV